MQNKGTRSHPAFAKPEKMLMGRSWEPVRANAIEANLPAWTRATRASRVKLSARLRARAQKKYAATLASDVTEPRTKLASA
jgi:hypothetical protein